MFSLMINMFLYRSCKILRKLEKLQKREKKLEHKLDQRLEKMESKKKRMLEKVSQTKTVKRKSGEGLGSVPYLMSGISTKPLSPVHVRPGEVFPRTWEILNDGTIPWTDAVCFYLQYLILILKPHFNICVETRCMVLDIDTKTCILQFRISPT